MIITDENLKIIVAVRSARNALGWSQQDVALKLGVARLTIARLETLAVIPKAELVARLQRLFRDHGVTIDPIFNEGVGIYVNEKALDEAKARLMDETLRRSDKKTKGPVNVQGDPVAQGA